MSHLSVFRILESFSCFSNKKKVFNGEQEKESIICEDGIEKSAIRDHCLSSLGNPRDANL